MPPPKRKLPVPVICPEKVEGVAGVALKSLIGTIRFESVALGAIFVITTVPDPLKSVTF